ncbi:MAG TPA: hypothetical protein VIP46_16215 [Pyrinomonadaceae bacterium]
MRNEQARRAARLLTLAALLLAGSANAYANRCEGRSPGELTVLLIPTVQTRTAPAETWWQDCLDPAFVQWPAGGSQNLPVVAAAVGMFISGRHDDDMPVRAGYSGPTDIKVSYIDWWTDFLEAQVGVNMTAIERPGKPSRTLPGQIRYFHSRESFSNIYDAPVVAAVAAIHFWAQKNSWEPGAGTLRGLARRYLRATWAVYAFAAGSGPSKLYRMGYKADLVTHALTTTEERRAVNVADPAPHTEYYPKSPLRADGTNYFGGNFLALAGQRSKIMGNRWAWDDRMPLFGRAMGTIQNYRSNESANTQKALLDYLQANWDAGVESLYGLSDADRNSLGNLIFYTSGASTLLPWLDGVRTNVTFRLLGWPSGVRASMMETNNNFFDTCVWAVKYDPATDPVNKVATFLFTWWDNPGSNSGWARLEQGLIRAYHPAKTKETSTGTRTLHPEVEAYITIPASNPTYHLVLSQNANPYLDGTPQTEYPPRPAPRDDWPPNY